jgi:phosphoglycolate phosphatase
MDRGYKELVLYDGIIELIDSLRSQGVKIAVATLKAQSTAEKIFASLGIVDRFDMIVGADPDNPRSKSQMLDFIVENYCKSMCADEDTDTDFDTNANANVGNVPVLVSEDIARSSIVLIGDSKYDSIGAEESHIDFIAVTYGFGFKSEADVEAYSHVAVCDSVEAISKSL